MKYRFSLQASQTAGGREPDGDQHDHRPPADPAGEAGGPRGHRGQGGGTGMFVC